MTKFSKMKLSNLDFDKINEKANILIDNFKNASTFKLQDEALKKYYKFYDDIYTTIQIIYIRFTVNTADKKYATLQDKVDELSPKFEAIFNRFNKELVNAKFKNELVKKYGEHLFNIALNSLECFDEKIIPDLQEINKLVTKYSSIYASAKIEYKGKIYNLSSLASFGESLDRNERKEVAILSANFFEKHDKEIGDIYDKLVHLRTNMAKKLGYKSFVELGYKMLGREDYDANLVLSFRKQIYNDLVPFTNSLFKRQAKRIKIKNPQYYDFNLNFLSGNAKPVGDKDFLVKQASKMYHELSKDTDYFFNFLVENELMDLESKPNKAPGGYMTYLPKYKAPFIFSNFNGTSGDVDVLTHEFGHAFQGYMSRNISIPDYRSPTLEACEIHSMSMEFLTYPWMHLFFKDQEEKYRYSHLVDAICFIPYGATIDEFQHFVYENPDATHEQRCMAYREIEKKYLPHKKYDEVSIYDRGRFWMKQRHVIESPFYYIDYTLAQVLAFEIFNEYIKNSQRAWNKYVRLCKLGGKYAFLDLLKHASLKNPFEEGMIKKVIGPLKKYLKSIDDMKY